MPLLILTGLFLLVAAAYSSVGFGGGSTYNALLMLSGTDFRLVPSIALTCNILVVSGGVYHYSRAGVLSTGKLLPFIVLSIPMAWLGGRLLVSEQVFIGLLGFSLLVAAAQMLLKPNATATSHVRYTNTRYWLVAAPIGGFIGLAGRYHRYRWRDIFGAGHLFFPFGIRAHGRWYHQRVHPGEFHRRPGGSTDESG